MSSSDLLRQAVDVARAGRRVEARTMLLELVEHDPRNEMAWIWLSGLVDDLDDRIIACENALTINPANDKVRAYLADLQSQKKEADIVSEQMAAPPVASPVQDVENKAVIANEPEKLKTNDPLQLAEQLELDGKYKEALEIYKVQAGVSKDLKLFDHIYQQIVRLERLQEEKIPYISPTLNIARLACTWPLLYFSLALVQVGIHPFARTALYLWLAFPLVIVGGFLLAISETKSRNKILQKLFQEDGDNIGFVQIVASVAGWLMIIAPIALIVLDSIRRLAIFQVPPELFP